MNGDISDFVEPDQQPVLRNVIAEIIGVLKDLHIVGIEVTQGIQYYQSASHLTDYEDRAPDNSVALIAGKPAWVRVYIRSGFLFPEIVDVTGTLTVIRRRDGAHYDLPGVRFSPRMPGSVTARRNLAYFHERGNRENTLNFVIPADQM